MLNTKDLHLLSRNILFYEGVNHYFIYKTNPYKLVVEKMIDADSGKTEKRVIGCCLLHSVFEEIAKLEQDDDSIEDIVGEAAKTFYK